MVVAGSARRSAPGYDAGALSLGTWLAVEVRAVLHRSAPPLEKAQIDPVGELCLRFYQQHQVRRSQCLRAST